MAGDGAKGKSVASGSGIVIDLVDGTSSKGDTVGHKSTTTTDNPEVVCTNGKRVKLSGPINYIWSHGTKYKVVGFSCGYCGKNISGGGATRFREHLAAISGSVVSCENVPLVVKKVMIDQVTNLRIRSKKNKKFRLFVEKEILQASKGHVMNDATIPLDEEALSGRLSAADWWDQYGGDYPDLQYFAKRIVGQCMSSSGCERNWSIFALVHTKLRNRLSYDKLHKLVYVHYNLKLRIQQYEDDFHSLQDMQTQHEMDSDPYSMLMDAVVFDDRNPIMDWLVNSRSESPPTLDENELANPSRFVIDELGLSDGDVAVLKETYLPEQVPTSSKKRKIQFDEEESAEDIESDSDQGSPIYVESGDSSSQESEGEDGADGAGTTNVQPTSSLRPRSKRLKKVSVKNLY